MPPEKALARYDRKKPAVTHLGGMGKLHRVCNENQRWVQGTPLRHMCVCVWREKSPMMKVNRAADRTLLAAGS